MLLRFRGPDGTQRLTVEEADTFATIGEKVISVFQHLGQRMLTRTVVRCAAKEHRL